MRMKLAWFTFLGIAIATTVLYTERARATPANGFTSSTVALGRFGNIDAVNEQLVDNPNKTDDRFKKIWLSIQKTKGDSDVYVQNNIVQPGGDSGWHSHPGHSLVIVTAGTITDYESDDPDCKPKVYTQGMGFVDGGGDHSHIIRNEGSIPASTMAVQVIPAGFARRIDAAAPGNCHF
jgi:uncharacterized cupin superfamily protein